MMYIINVAWHNIYIYFPLYSWCQYFKMDRNNYDNNGVDHLKYCFEVHPFAAHLHVL